jgi:diacylglycerol O-acyltransferase
MLLALGTRLAVRVPQRSLNTVTTNVPGPQHPLFLAGRRMLEAIPYVPIANQVRIGIAIFSYDGALKFGVTGDYDSAPDIRILGDGIENGMAALVKAAQGAARPAPQRAKGKAKTARPAQAAARPASGSARPAPGSTTSASGAADEADGASSRETT